MRAIRKTGVEPQVLARACRHPPPDAAAAQSRWHSFKHKARLSEVLSNEQYGLCAYSELRPDQEGIGTHIEHVVPKSLEPARTFDYHNLVLSALSDADLSALTKEDHFGGHAKGREYDPQRFVSPLQQDAARYFAYLSDGRVVPSIGLAAVDQERARYTIERLNLNCSFLLNRRKRWLDELDALIEEHLASEMSLDHLAAVYLLPCNQRLDPFFTASRQRFGPLAERLLTAEARELV